MRSLLNILSDEEKIKKDIEEFINKRSIPKVDYEYLARIVRPIYEKNIDDLFKKLMDDMGIVFIMRSLKERKPYPPYIINEKILDPYYYDFDDL